MFGDHFRTVSRDTDGRAGTLDLQLVSAATVLAAVILIVPVDEPTLLRAVVGLPLVLFLPGYAAAAALFPARPRRPSATVAAWQTERRAISAVERVVIAVVASVALVGAAGIVANAVVGVHLPAILAVLVAFTLFASVTAYAQRRKLPEERRFAPLSSLAGPTGPTLPATATGWFLLAAAVLALVVVTAGGVAALGPDGDGVTEFYVGGASENGTISMGAQPTTPTAGETTTHYLVLSQRNAAAGEYTVVARLANGTNGNVTSANGTSVNGTNPTGTSGTSGNATATNATGATVTGAATEIGRYQFSVNDTATAVQPVEFSVDAPRENATVEYYLYEGAAPETVGQDGALRYLRVQLTVRSE